MTTEKVLMSISCGIGLFLMVSGTLNNSVVNAVVGGALYIGAVVMIKDK